MSSTGDPRSGHPRTADAQVERACEDALARLGKFPGVRIRVSAGRLDLTGNVPTGADRWRVEEALGQVQGVTGTNGQLMIAR